MRALTRAHSREVSTSSADITQRGGFLNSAEPGKIANLALRAPRYSFLSVSFSPMCDSRPASSETWTRLRVGVLLVERGCPSTCATVRSWLIDVLPLADPQVVEVLRCGTCGGTRRRTGLFCCSRT